LLIALGIGFVVWGWSLVEAARATLAWPVASGRIVQSEIDSWYDEAEDETMYSVNLTYRYAVDGNELTAERRSLADYSSSSLRQMERIRDRYPPDAPVQVYYDPDNPGSALLRPGPAFVTWIPLTFGMLSIAAGLASLLRRRAQVPPAS
jgi:hypothetical protein